jgi:hypothetical protein
MRKLAIVASLTVMLAACGGGASLESNGGTSHGSSSSSSGGTSSSSGTSVGAASLTGIASSPTVASDGSTTSTITVYARNASNDLIAGVVVTFSATGAGAVDVTQGTTGTNGEATAVLTALNAPVGTPIMVNFTGGGHTGSVPVQVVSPQSTGSTTITPAGLSLSTNTQSIPADGSSSATITAIATNANNNVLSGVPVCFSLAAGSATSVSITPTSPNANGCVVTGNAGTATATLTAIPGVAKANDVALVVASVGTLTTKPPVQVTVSSTQTGTTTVVSSLQLSASPGSIYSDGSTTSTITALALDAANNVLSGVPVSFTTTSDDATAGAVAGALAVSQPAVTGANGTLTASLSTGGNTDLRTITVSALAEGAPATVHVKVLQATTPVTPIYAMGNGTAAAFTANAIAVGAPSLSAGGTTSLSLTIVTTNAAQANTLYNAGPVTVTFNSPCLSNNLAQLIPSGSTTPSLTITTTTGSVNASYVAKGCNAADLINASATIGTQNIGASATVTTAPATIGSIQFVSATPTTIGLKGTGLNETSTVIFKVTDSTGGAYAGVGVNFSLDTSVGGLALNPQTATSAADGTVQTVVSAGTVHTTVRVTATIPAVTTGPSQSPQLSTQSSGLTVTTGLPTSGSFSIAVGKASNAPSGNFACPNVEGFDINLITVPITVQLADRYNNPAPDGTSVAFHTDGGSIGGSCSTPLRTSGDGACQVTWTSANPRPGQNPYTGALDLNYGYNPPPAGGAYNPNLYVKGTNYNSLVEAGRAVILATTIGEESFTDLSGSGFYIQGDPFADLGDPYESDNEQAIYEVGDYFIDFYQKQAWTPPSGAFKGITCTGITPADTCATQTLAIGASHLMIMSTSAASITADSALLTNSTGFTALKNGNGQLTGLQIGQGATGTIVVDIADLHNNAMPAGTTVGWTFSNGSIGATLTAIAPTVVGCDSGTGGEVFEASFTSGTGNGGSGVAYVSVTSPSGTQTVASIPITIIPAPTVTVTSNPNALPAGGGSSTLSWTATNATSCTVPTWYTGTANPLPTSGSQTVNGITATTNFTLTCTGLGGQGLGQAVVTVGP